MCCLRIAATALLYAAPTVPPGSEVVVTARLLGWLEFCRVVLPLLTAATGEKRRRPYDQTPSQPYFLFHGLARRWGSVQIEAIIFSMLLMLNLSL